MKRRDEREVAVAGGTGEGLEGLAGVAQHQLVPVEGHGEDGRDPSPEPGEESEGDERSDERARHGLATPIG